MVKHGALVVEDVQMTYKTAEGLVRAVRGVTFSVKPGEFYTLSTLLLANLVWGQWELGSIPMASAYIVVLIMIVVALVFIGRGRLGEGDDP